MKKIFTVILFSINCSIYSQLSLPDSSATWSISLISWGQCGNNFSFGIVGDSIIDKTKYVTVFSTNDSIFNLSKARYYCSIRDSSGYWKFIFPDKSKGLTLYNFNSKSGDTLTVNNYLGQSVKIKIVSIDSILINNKYRRRWNVSQNTDVSPYIWESWIEGIGSTHGLIYSSLYIIDAGYELNCFHQNNQLYYSVNGNCGCKRDSTLVKKINEFGFLVYPNPVNKCLTIESIVNVCSYKIINSIGNLVKVGNLKYGINKIDISELEPGLFSLNIITGKENLAYKIVKQK